MNKKALAIISTMAMVICVHLSGIPAYLYALHLESKWVAASPKTESELEKFLSFYSKLSIDPKNSPWGNGYILKDNERMIQYLILWKAPLDVVYNVENEIQAIYTSYE